MDEKIIRKIQKALALAKDTKSDGETQAAMLAVQRMLANHNLSMQDVESYGSPAEKKTKEERVTELSGRIPWWHKKLAYVISDNFKCKYFMVRYGSYNGAIVFFGLEEDVAIAKEVYQYAKEMIDKLAKSYVGKLYRQGESTKGVRNIYIEGFLRGLQDKFKEQIEKNNWGLVLVTDALVVQEYEAMNMRTVKSTGIQPKFSNNSEAYNEGKKQGENFASNKKGIEG
jgi:hypothetical protein